MNHDLEMLLTERDVVRDLAAACAAVAPDMAALCDANGFDGWVELTHEGEMPEGVDFRLVRRMRDGRDFDPSRPSDWHVRYVSHVVDRADVRTGTRIVLCQAFRAPPGYAEPDSTR